MKDEPVDTQVLRYFTAARGSRVGRFVADPATGWWWDDATSAILGYPAGSVDPCWRLMLATVPAADRDLVNGAHAAATSRAGRFSWSHRVVTGGLVRSVLVVGDSQPKPQQRSALAAVNGDRAAGHVVQPDDVSGAPLRLSGYVLDLTDLRVDAARAAGTDAVQRATAHRATIEQAKGMVMLAYHLDADAAFALLARHSQQTNRKLHVIAASLLAAVHADGLPSTPLRATLNRILAGQADTQPLRGASTHHAGIGDR